MRTGSGLGLQLNHRVNFLYNRTVMFQMVIIVGGSLYNQSNASE